MSRPKYIRPVAGVRAYDRAEARVDLEVLRGRRIKKVFPKPDGSVVVMLDEGPGVEGLAVRFETAADYEACKQEGKE